MLRPSLVGGLVEEQYQGLLLFSLMLLRLSLIDPSHVTSVVGYDQGY